MENTDLKPRQLTQSLENIYKYKLALAFMRAIQVMPDSFFIKDSDRENCLRKIKSFLMENDNSYSNGRKGRVKSSIAAL